MSQRVIPPGTLYALVKAAIKARVVDISCHGTQIEVASQLAPATPCQLVLPSFDGGMRLKALVQRCRARCRSSSGQLLYRAGLRFCDLSAAERERIEDSIVELCLSERRAEP